VRGISACGCSASAATLTLTGAVPTLSALPFGVPLVAGGLVLMSTVDRTCRRAMIGARKKSFFFNKIICKSGTILSALARKITGLTYPQTDKPDPDVKIKER